MTERSDQFIGDVVQRIARVFGAYQLEQAEAVAICAQLAAFAIHSNADQAAQADQLEKMILIIRQSHHALASEPPS